MTDGDAGSVLIINPLNEYALAHYEDELVETLERSGRYNVETADTVAGDAITGSRHRVAVAVRTVWERTVMARSVSGRIVIVIWPLFGYFEPLTLVRLARRNTVYIVVHDPSPLRRSYGQSRWARVLFKTVGQCREIRVLYHTEQARRVGAELTGVNGTVVPHPVALVASQRLPHRGDGGSRPVIRVLGAYKNTRSITALTMLADHAAGEYDLEIHGRGWPEVQGWTVANRFVPEDEFASLVASSDCVVIPYVLFFQSGVAVRCLESGVPVVAPQHEHIVQLYGQAWPGTVRGESDWGDALVRALAIDADEIRSRHHHVAGEILGAWREFLSTAAISRTGRRT